MILSLNVSHLLMMSACDITAADEGYLTAEFTELVAMATIINNFCRMTINHLSL